jgi:hypothetical protein
MTRSGLGCLPGPVEWSNRSTLFESHGNTSNLRRQAAPAIRKGAHGRLRGPLEQERSFRRFLIGERLSGNHRVEAGEPKVGPVG